MRFFITEVIGIISELNNIPKIELLIDLWNSWYLPMYDKQIEVNFGAYLFYKTSEYETYCDAYKMYIEKSTTGVGDRELPYFFV